MSESPKTNTGTGPRFSDSHEWHVLEGNTVTIGISRFAVDELTDVTYVELPGVGDTVTAGEAFGEIESVKATSDLYSGVTGKVTAVNDKAVEDPAIINDDPQGSAWLIKVKADEPAQLDALMDEAAYNAKYPTE